MKIDSKSKVIGSVYSAYNYEIFKRLEYNRPVLQRRLEKLIASFSSHEVINPIVVNENYEIIDGQGRYEAKKSLGLPIYYIIDAKADITDCRRMNTYNTEWKTIDFVKSYAESGNENYINLINLHNDTKAPIRRIMRLANHTHESPSVLREGKLVFTKEDADMVTRILVIVQEITEALIYQNQLNDAFYTAVKVMSETEGYNHERMLTNCKNCRTTFNQMSNLEAMLKEFSRIYNYRSKGKKLYFEDYMRNRGYNVRSYEEAGRHWNDDTDISSLRKEKK